MSHSTPKWSAEELDLGRRKSIQIFRQERMAEPLEDYLEHFLGARSSIEDLLELTVDLSLLRQEAVHALIKHEEAVRYLAGPPISKDDLVTVAESSLSPTRLASDPQTAQRIIDTVLLGLDRERFPWVGEDREPTEAEKLTSIIATAALVAARKVMTSRANESKDIQEEMVKEALRRAGFTEVPARDIPTLHSAPGLGEFCGESMFGTRKADIVVRLWDHRVLALECKVSNSSTNSIKRLNNDAAVKAKVWISQFGTAQTVPAAMIAGVFKLRNLESAQDDGLTIWWSHDLAQMIDWIESSRL